MLIDEMGPVFTSEALLTVSCEGGARGHVTQVQEMVLARSQITSQWRGGGGVGRRRGGQSRLFSLLRKQRGESDLAWWAGPAVTDKEVACGRVGQVATRRVRCCCLPEYTARTQLTDV